jgi:two-component system, OmpR family, alkaline phosphatase synthesis response regulator PhoP
MKRVLIVEDEQHLADGLRFNLEAEGYQVEILETGEEALHRLVADSTPFDVLILDVMLPGKDGFSVMAEMRHAGQFIPTLMLTARGHPHDVLRGFEAGADDYLIKPFQIARIRSLLRRQEWMDTLRNESRSLSKPRDVFTFGDKGDKAVNFDLSELCVRGQVFRLTLMEANLLRYLIEHEGQSVSRKTMLEDVWGLQDDTDTRPIDNFIVRLRRYIEENPTRPCHLLTVRGIGYRFVAGPPS